LSVPVGQLTLSDGHGQDHRITRQAGGL